MVTKGTSWSRHKPQQNWNAYSSCLCIEPVVMGNFDYATKHRKLNSCLCIEPVVLEITLQAKSSNRAPAFY